MLFTSLGVGTLSLCLADNLMCGAQCPNAFGAAGFTAQYVRSVDQDVSPGKCVLLSTSKSVGNAMKLWDISGCGRFWKVQLDVRDLGRRLDFTNRARAGTLSCRVKGATAGVAAVGALPLAFQVKLVLVWCKYLPAGLHAVEASFVSSSSLSAFMAAVVRAVGPVRCLWLTLLRILICLIGRWVLVLRFILFGSGFA